MRYLRHTVLVLAVLAILVGLAIVLRVPLVNWSLQLALGGSDQPLKAEVTAISLEEVVMRKLALGEPGAEIILAEELRVRHTPSRLWQGEVDSLEIISPVVRIIIDKQKADEPQRSGDAATDDEANVATEDALPWPPPFLPRQISVTGGRFILQHGDQEFSTGFAAEATLEGDNPWLASARLTADGSLGTAQASFTATLDHKTVRDFALTAQAQLLPSINPLLPDQIRFNEAGTAQLSVDLQSGAALPLRALQQPSPAELLAALPLKGKLETSFRGLVAPGWSDQSDGEAEIDIAHDGSALTLGAESRAQLRIRPSADLPSQAVSVLALLGLQEESLTLTLRARDGERPLAIVAASEDGLLQLDGAATADLSDESEIALSLSTDSLARFDLRAGALLAAELNNLEAACRCRHPETTIPFEVSAETGLTYTDGKIAIPDPLIASVISGGDTDLATLLDQPQLTGLLGDSLLLRLAPQAASEALLSAAPSNDGALDLAWQIDGRLWSTGAMSGLVISSSGAAAMPEDGTLPSLARTDATLATSPLTWNGQEIDTLRASTVLQGNLEDLAARVHLALDANRLQFGDRALRDATLDSEIAARLQSQTIKLDLTAPTRIDLAGIEGLPGQLAAPLSLTLSEGSATASLTQEPAWTATIEGLLGALQLRAEGRDVSVSETEISLAAAGGGGSGLNGEGRLVAKSLALSEPAVSAGRTALSFEMEGETITASLAPTRVTQAVAPEVPTQLTLSGQGRLRNDHVTGQARAALTESVAATAKFSHDLAKGRGEAEVVFPVVTFLPGGLQPAALSPLLTEIKDASGTLSASAQLAWQGDAISGSAVAEASQLSLTYGELFVEGLNSEITFSSLLPLASDGLQRFSATRAGSGDLDLEDIEGRFLISSDGPEAIPTLQLEEAQGGIAGGRLRLKEQIVQPGTIVHPGRVEVEDIDLALLLERLQVDGLSGRGRLSGQLPVQLEGDTVIVQGGEVSADAPGRIAYNSETTRQALANAGEHMQLTLDALEDFNFTDLALRLDKPASGDSTLAITLEGANPNVLDNYPFRFNIRLTGDPEPFISAIKDGTRLSDEIVRRAWRLSR